jgi:hypothetical protein
VAARKQKQSRMSAQVVEDEDYQLRYEIAAGVDVAKESAVVCVRMPPAAGKKHRTSHLQTVPATVPAITGLAAELVALGCRWCRWRPPAITGGSGCDMRSHCLSEITETEGRLIGS